MEPGTGPDPEHSNRGGIDCRRHEVSNLSCQGESMRGGSPSHIGGSGGIPREKFGKLWCRRSVFKPVLGQNVRFQT